MSKPSSIKVEPWTDFDKQSYSIVSDDFVHSKLLAVKTNLKSDKGTVNLKESVTKKGDALKSDGEIKLWFPFWNARSGSLYFRAKTNDVKLHYDDGVKGFASGQFKTYNLYTSIQSDKTLKNLVLKAGAKFVADKFNLENRVRVGLSDQGKTDISSGHKFSFAQNEWSFDSFETIGYKNSALLNNAIRIGYRLDKYDFFFRAENHTSRNFKGFNAASLDSYFTKFIFDVVTKVDNNTKVAVETEFAKSEFKKASVVLQRLIPNRDTTIKFRVTSDKAVTLSYQAAIKDYGKWTAGAEVSDLGKNNKSLFGIQVDLNI